MSTELFTYTGGPLSAEAGEMLDPVVVVASCGTPLRGLPNTLGTGVFDELVVPPAATTAGFCGFGGDAPSLG